MASKLMYRNWPISVFGGCFFGFCTCMFIVQAFNPGKGGLGLIVLAGVTAAATAALTVRTLVAPTVTAGHNGVRIRTLQRTRHYDWAEIDRFNAVTMPVRAYNRKVLTITLKSGGTRPFPQLNSGPKRPGWVDDAATALNQHLAELQAAGAAPA
jgi:hypothetical protein